MQWNDDLPIIGITARKFEHFLSGAGFVICFLISLCVGGRGGVVGVPQSSPLYPISSTSTITTHDIEVKIQPFLTLFRLDFIYAVPPLILLI